MFQWTILKSFQPKLVKSENIIQRLSALLKRLSERSIKCCKNRKIGLWRIISNDNHEIIFNRTINRIKNNDEIISNALTSENFQDISATNIFIQTPLRFTSIPKDLIYDFLSLQKDISQKNFHTTPCKFIL